MTWGVIVGLALIVLGIDVIAGLVVELLLRVFRLRD